MAEKMVNITIDGIFAQVSASYTILQAADEMGIFIPRLCFLKDISETSACRVCVVQIEGMRTLKNSCAVKVWDGMKVHTKTPQVISAVRQILQLMAMNHNFDCWHCPREHNCEFLSLLRRYDIDNSISTSQYFSKKERHLNGDNPSIVFDSSKCILCGRCVGACEKLSGLGILNYNERGFVTFVSTANGFSIEDAGCIYCGKCIQSCPTGAIHEKEENNDVIVALEDPNKYVVAQIAPSVRAAIAEEFDCGFGINAEGKIYAALKELGFDDITDANFGADVTIMEEGTEFLGRLNKHLKGEQVAFPMFTSCSPGWIRYIERYYPEYLDNLSTTKSPQQIQGALIKHYYSDLIGVKKEDIVVVSIMPCIAKKYEARRPEMESDGVRDVDYVLTTRELAKLIKRRGIKFNELADYKPDSLLAKYTGAGAIFGASGGVMEAALRTVIAKVDPQHQDSYDLSAVRGVDNGIKEATLNINGLDVNVAVVNGAANIKEMFERIKKGDKQYHFIEVMACSGGCINGGGQPIVNARTQERINVKELRAKVLYQIDDENALKKSHLNPYVERLYKDFLIEPNGHLSHKLLHTSYSKKKVY